jgi:hypothetical protein
MMVEGGYSWVEGVSESEDMGWVFRESGHRAIKTALRAIFNMNWYKIRHGLFPPLNVMVKPELFCFQLLFD